MRKEEDTDTDSEDPVEKKRLDREREVKADMSNAAELFGHVAISRECVFLLWDLYVILAMFCF